MARVRPGDEGEVLTTATVSFSASASARTEVVRPKLGVAVSGPADAAAGETVTFTVQLTNAGSGPADGVRLRARLPQGLSHPQGDYIEAELGDLPPGGTRTVRLPVTAARAGSHKCEVSASTAGGLYASDAASVRVVEPGLELRQHGPTSVALGGEAELHLDLTNPGSAPGKAVTVAMHLPEGLDFLGAANGGAYDPAGRRVLWQVDALPPGPPVRLTARARASAVGTVRSRSVARAGDLQAGAEAVVRVEGVPQAGLEVVDLDDPVRQGAETNYEIRVANVGSVPLTQLRVTAELPDCLELRAAGGPVPYHPEVSAVAFDPLDRLGVQADAVYRVRVRAAAAGTARVRVKLTCAELPDPLVQEQTTRVTAGP